MFRRALPSTLIGSSHSLLRLSAVGVDISDRGIKFIAFSEEKGERKVSKFGEVRFEEGIVERGRIVDHARLVDVLKALRNEHDLSVVRAALHGDGTFFFRTRIKDGNDKEIHAAIGDAFQKYADLSPDDVVFDFTVLSRSGGDSDIAVSAARRDLVDEYVSAFRDAGLVLSALELESDVLARALISEKDQSAYLLVDLGEYSTGLTIVSGREVESISTITLGGHMLSETLARHFGVSIEGAEGVKKEIGLRRTGNNEELFNILLNNVSVLKDEIYNYIMHWHMAEGETDSSRSPIGHLMLSGGGANLAGFPEYLSATLRIPALTGNVWVNAGLPAAAIPRLTRLDSLRYATAVGLALPAGSNFRNLLPEIDIEEATHLRRNHVLIVTCAAIAGLALFGSLLTIPTLLSAKKKIADLSAAIASDSAPTGDDFMYRLALASGLPQNSPVLAGFVDPVLRAKDAKIHIASFHYSEKDADASLLQISGTADTAAAFDAFQAKLVADPKLAGVSVSTDPGKVGRISFTVTMTGTRK